MNKDASFGTGLMGMIRRIVPALLLIAMPNVSFAAVGTEAVTPGISSASPALRTDEAADPPITVVVTRYVKRGCEVRFEKLWRDMVPVRNAFPGHLGSDFIVPVSPGDSSYHMLYRFDNASHYQAWVQSPERAAWLHQLDEMTLGAPQYQYENGLGAWVALPEQSGKVPEKYKTTAVTWLAIFPLVAVISVATSAVTAPLLGPLPFLVNTAIVTGLVVPALSYAVMPGMTWLFRDWLYPTAPECRADGVPSFSDWSAHGDRRGLQSRS